MRYTLLVTGPPYGTQQASSAWQFANALIASGHTLDSVFFYREGVLNANEMTQPASDEFDLVRAWQDLQRHGVKLIVCVSAALRRGVLVTSPEQQRQTSDGDALMNFQFSGLGALAEATLNCDRIIQF